MVMAARKTLATMFLTVVVVLSGMIGLNVQAASSYAIEYDKETQKFVVDDSDFYNNLHDMMPGESTDVSITFKNSALTSRELFFYIVPDEEFTDLQKDLAERMSIDISMTIDGVETNIYSGSLSNGSVSNPDIVSLGTIKSGKTGTFLATVSVPADIDNTYSGVSIPVVWRFYISDSGLKVETPVADPVGDTYYETQYVELFCATEGAEIYYTTDGTEPTEKSSKYVSAIKVDENTVIKAFAVKDEYEDSDVMTEKYVIKCQTPVADPVGDTYSSEQYVRLTTETEGATIYYTIDGTTPTKNSLIYTDPITVEKNTVIKAFAAKENCEDSGTMSETYIIQAKPPVISPESGTYTDELTVTISHDNEDAVIYYTIDGSEPDIEDKVYTKPLAVDKETTVKAIAVVPEMAISETAAETYLIQLSPPTILPESGTYTERVEVAITHPVYDVEIRYTTDGSEPTAESYLYTDPFEITVDTTITAKAFKSGAIESDPAEESYVIKAETSATLDPPVISPESGIYEGKIIVTITHDDPSVVIRYTITGEEPTEDSPVYEGEFTLDSNTTVSAKAYPPDNAESLEPSKSVSETYKFKLSPPQITPESGTYIDEVEVTITHDDEDVTIYYTVDGTEPTENSNIYTGPFVITENTKVKAFASKENTLSSDSVSETYEIKLSPPEIIPAGGIYDESVKATIVHEDDDVTIYYTIDGSIPDENSEVYVEPFEITENTTVKAIAVKENTTSSDPDSEDYRIRPATPVITPESGTYESEVEVSIECDTPNAVIHYTTDGSEPTEDSPVYTGHFTVDTDTQVKAIAVSPDGEYSDRAMEEYIITQLGKVSKPVANPAGGTYYEPITVEISCDTDGATIYYTLDGSMPAENSSIYTDPIEIDAETVIYAFAVKDGMEDSEIMCESYVFKVAKPVATPSGAVYSSTQTVELSCETEGATIYYSLDDGEYTVYNGSIKVAKNTTIKAYAIKSGWLDSDIMAEKYVIIKSGKRDSTAITGTPFLYNNLSQPVVTETVPEETEPAATTTIATVEETPAETVVSEEIKTGVKSESDNTNPVIPVAICTVMFLILGLSVRKI